MVLILVMTFIKMPLYASNTDTVLQKKQALDLVNQIRQEYNIDALTPNTYLDEAAYKHASYMYRNNVLSSIEEKDKRNYSGRYPWDRAAYHNYDLPIISEFIDKDEPSYVYSLTNFLNNPYSRVTLLDPLYKDLGFGNLYNYYSFELGGETTTKKYNYKVMYPYNNQINVPIKWTNKFALDPYANGSNEKYGVPVTYTYYSDRDIKEINVDVKNTEIYDITNKEIIPIHISTPKEDKYLNHTLLLLPEKVYEYGSRYRVKISAEVVFDDRTEVIEEVFYFKTVESNNLVDADELVTRGRFAQMLIEALDINKRSVTISLFRDVPITHPYSDAIHTAYSQSYIYGYGNGTFGPEHILTREQLITMVMRVYDRLKKDDIDPSTITLPFKDKADISDWSLEAIKKAYALEIIVGTTDNTVVPQQFITEAQVNIILNKLLQRLEE